MLRAAEKAGRSLVRDFGEVEQLQVSKKGPNDFVTAADKRSEEIIHAELLKARPDYGFLMEESGTAGSDPNAEIRWIVDPLDGTFNFLHGAPYWSIAIALEEKGEITAGIVYDPVKDEMFRAEKGNGAFNRNKRLRVSGRTNFSETIIAGDCPFRNKDEINEYVSQFDRVAKKAGNVRRNGSACLDLAYVAAGRYDGYWTQNLSPWDLAAPSIIVREAGGLFTEISGKANPIYNGNVIAGNDNNHGELKRILNAKQNEQNAA